MVIGPHVRHWNDSQQLVLRRPDFDDTSGGQFLAAARRAAKFLGEPVVIAVAIDPEETFDEDAYSGSGYTFSYDKGDLLYVEVTCFHNAGVDDPKPDFRAVLKPLLDRYGMSYIDEEIDLWWRADPTWMWHLNLSLDPRRRKMRAVLDGLDQLCSLLDAWHTGHLTATTARDLILGGHVSALVGQLESSWLEAKSQQYDLSTEAGKLDAAEMVAQFANSENGGLVVIGLKTKTGITGEDVIKAISPVPSDPKNARRYADIIRSRVFPPLVGHQIDAVTVPGGEIILIAVPPQPEESKPFLIHGAIPGRGKFRGTYISILTRDGDRSVSTRAESIHASLVAGRALLRGSEVSGK